MKKRRKRKEIEERQKEKKQEEENKESVRSLNTRKKKWDVPSTLTPPFFSFLRNLSSCFEQGPWAMTP